MGEILRKTGGILCLMGEILRKTDGILCLMEEILRKMGGILCLMGEILRKMTASCPVFRSKRGAFDGSCGEIRPLRPCLSVN
jgi:hypothetical protein